MRTRRKIWEKEQVNAMRAVVKALLSKFNKNFEEMKDKIIDLDGDNNPAMKRMSLWKIINQDKLDMAKIKDISVGQGHKGQES